MTDIDCVSELLSDYPCLWSPRDPNYHNAAVKDESLKQLLEKYNETEDKLDMPTLVGLIDIVKSQRKTQSETNVITPASQPSQMSQTGILMGDNCTEKKPTFKDIVSEFPFLWDPNDMNYADKRMKSRYKQIVLEKFNRYSSVPITRADLDRKLNTMKARHKRAANKAPNLKTPGSYTSKPTFNDIISEFPCLWDPNDLNYTDKTMRKRYKQIVLEKLNRLSCVPITRADLDRKLFAMKARRERETKKAPKLVTTESAQSKPTFNDIISEFPCLWDPNDLNYTDKTLRKRYKQIVLEKLNRLSCVPITRADLDRKLFAMNVRRGRETKKAPKLVTTESAQGKQARSAGENAAGPARVLTWNLPQEPTNLDACQIINECKDTANHVVVGAVITFDWCRVCGEVKKQYVDATCDEKPYIAINKTKLAVNDLNIELDFADIKLPTNICEDCDKKLVDMCKFIELVKSTQDKFNINIDTQKRTQDEAENNENTEQIKKCQVTIDLNAITVPRLGDENIQEVPGTGECTDENEIKMKMMRNVEQHSDSDEDNLVIKVEDPYDDDNDYKMAEKCNNDDFVDFTSVPSCVDENDIEIKSKIEVGPITISKGSDNVLEEIDKWRVSTDTSQSLLESFNDGSHRESVGVTANDATFRDSFTLDKGMKRVFSDNISNAQSTVADMCEESAANIDIKKVVNIDSDTDEEQGGTTFLNNEDEMTVNEENIESDNSIIIKDNATSNSSDEESEGVITVCGMKFSLRM